MESIFSKKVSRSQINSQTLLAREWSRNWDSWPNYMCDDNNRCSSQVVEIPQNKIHVSISG